MAKKAPPDLEEKVKAALGQLALADPSKPKESYAFWGTQPVAQFGEGSGEAAVSCAWRPGHWSGRGAVQHAMAPPPAAHAARAARAGRWTH